MIVVCGEALIDMFVANDGTLSVGAHAGGSPFNVAIGLARLGMPASFFGGLADDPFGRYLRDCLRREGVDLSAAPQPADRTALACVSSDEYGSPTYRFYCDDTAERMVTTADLMHLPTRIGALHLGSYCMVVEPVAAAQRMLVERQRGRSLIAYDPNVRLGIEPNIAKWRATLEWMAARVDLLKVSEEDLECLYPEQSIETFMLGVLAAGVSLVVVTRGARGVLARNAAGVNIALEAMPVSVVDTVGAGDSFQAALIARLVAQGVSGPDSGAILRALDATRLHEALNFARRAAALTCSRRGADLPTLAQVAGAG
jgi:fructokinase